MKDLFDRFAIAIGFRNRDEAIMVTLAATALAIMFGCIIALAVVR